MRTRYFVDEHGVVHFSNPRKEGENNNNQKE